jgi:hypothetical protein
MSTNTPLSFKVLTTLLAQRIVSVGTGGDTVIYPASNQALPIGVTTDTVLDTTSAIPVQVSGIAKLHFNQTVTTGGLVGSDSSGRGIAFTLANTTTALTLASAYVGTLVGPTIADTGTIAEISINPGFDRE